MNNLINLLNSNFSSRAILSVDTQDTFVVFKTWDATHGYSRHIYLKLAQLRSWLWSDDGDSYEERDLHSSVRFYRGNEQLSVELTSISESNGELSGFIHRFKLDPSCLYDALCTRYSDSHILITTDESNSQAKIVLPRSTHQYLRDSVLPDSKLKRAFVKSISHSFMYGKDSVVTLYPDYDGFFFQETVNDHRGLCGGLIISKSNVCGRDGQLHESVSYHVHT